MSRYPSPDTEQAFERFCVELLREHWKNPDLQLYGRRGEKQRGVDIYDPTSDSPFRAAQCKHHKPHMSLPPEEIRAEVAKALTFTPPLDRYTILTTAKESTNADDTVVEINTCHRKEKKFIVTLLNWERDIEPLLDKYKSVAEQLFTFTGDHLNEMTKSIRDLSRTVDSYAQTTLETISTAVAFSAIDKDLDLAELLLKNHDLDGARGTLERIENQHGGSLTPRQRYRVQVGIANVLLVRGKRSEAGKRLLSVVGLQPDDVKAQINEVLGYEMSGDRGRAYELAVARLEGGSASAKLVACKVRTSPDSVSLEALESELDHDASKDAEVRIALSLRAMGLGRFADAERHARAAIDSEPTMYNPRALLGQSLLNQEAMKMQRSIWEGGDSLDSDRLREALRAMDDAIKFARREKALHSLPDSYLIRAHANVLLQDNEGAEQDFEQAIQEERDWAPARRRFAQFLFQRGRDDEAVRCLRRAVQIGTDTESKYVLAGILSGKEDKTLRLEATNIFIDLAQSVGSKSSNEASSFSPGRPLSIPTAAFHSAIDDLVRQGRLGDAERLVETAPGDNVHQLGRLSARSRLSLARGDTVAASGYVSEALSLLTDAASVLDLRSLAYQLERLERHKDALGIWQQIVKNSAYDLDVRRLVRCAKLIKRFDVVLETAEATRKSQIDDPWLFFEEIETLSSFDLEKAVSLLRERAAKHPGDTHLHLNLAFLGLKWHRPDLIDPRPELYPPVGEVEPENGAIVVKLLREYGDIQEALGYAYELLRLYPDHPAAASAICGVFYTPGSKSPDIVTPAEVGRGTAVRFSELEFGEQWVVIEDSPNPRPGTEEISPDSPLANSLLGRRVGDIVTLSLSSGRPRTAVIKEVKSKYLHVVHDVFTNWQLRFPNDSYVQIFNASKEDEDTGEIVPDLTDIKMVADTQLEQLNAIEQAYSNSFVSIDGFARSVGRLPFNATCYLAANPGLFLRSNQGSEEERTSALLSLESSNTLVLDITALAMAFNLDLRSVLKRWPGKLLVSQHTALELRKTRRFLADKIGSFGTYGKNEHGYFLFQWSQKAAEDYHDAFAAFVDFVDENFGIASCPRLANMAPDKRDELEGLLSRHGLESVLLASQPGHVLFTEDAATAIVATHDFSAARVWTQLILVDALNTNALSQDEYLLHTVKLLVSDVRSTQYDPQVVVKAAAIAGWDVDRQPLTAVLEQLARCSDRKFILVTLTVLIKSLHEQSVSPVALSANMTRLLNRFSAMNQGENVIRMLPQTLNQAFGIDVAGAHDACGLVLAWLDSRRRWPDIRLL